jgi:hypothetical protein
VKRWVRAVAVAAPVILTAYGVTACESTTVICSGKNCPVTVASRHDDRICGPAGCAWYYWLYFSDGLFSGVPYAAWRRYQPGAYYATAGTLYAGAGTSVFVQLNPQLESSEDDGEADASESYEDVVESTATEVSNAEEAEIAGDADPEEESVSSDESFEAPDSYSDDDVSVGDDDG